jgi:hypothetical protein
VLMLIVRAIVQFSLNFKAKDFTRSFKLFIKINKKINQIVKYEILVTSTPEIILFSINHLFNVDIITATLVHHKFTLYGKKHILLDKILRVFTRQPSGLQSPLK